MEIDYDKLFKDSVFSDTEAKCYTKYAQNGTILKRVIKDKETGEWKESTPEELAELNAPKISAKPKKKSMFDEDEDEFNRDPTLEELERAEALLAALRCEEENEITPEEEGK